MHTYSLIIKCLIFINWKTKIFFWKIGWKSQKEPKLYLYRARTLNISTYSAIKDRKSDTIRTEIRLVLDKIELDDSLEYSTMHKRSAQAGFTPIIFSWTCGPVLTHFFWTEPRVISSFVIFIHRPKFLIPILSQPGGQSLYGRRSGL